MPASTPVHKINPIAVSQKLRLPYGTESFCLIRELKPISAG